MEFSCRIDGRSPVGFDMVERPNAMGGLASSIDFNFSDRCGIYSGLGSDIEDTLGPQNTTTTSNVVELRPRTGYLHPRNESNFE